MPCLFPYCIWRDVYLNSVFLWHQESHSNYLSLASNICASAGTGACKARCVRPVKFKQVWCNQWAWRPGSFHPQTKGELPHRHQHSQGAHSARELMSQEEQVHFCWEVWDTAETEDALGTCGNWWASVWFGDFFSFLSLSGPSRKGGEKLFLFFCCFRNKKRVFKVLWGIRVSHLKGNSWTYRKTVLKKIHELFQHISKKSLWINDVCKHFSY